VQMHNWLPADPAKVELPAWIPLLVQFYQMHGSTPLWPMTQARSDCGEVYQKSVLYASEHCKDL
jgi:hypothetical protein